MAVPERVGKGARAGWVLLLVLGLPACAHHGPPGGRPPLPAALYSPNGEALNGGPLGTPGCSAAMGAWFGRVDANRDGRIDRAEFMADARAQFARMDVEHFGMLTSEDLDRYRAPYREGLRPGMSDRPDPVMSADRDLDFQVSRDEFLAQARDVFARLAAGEGTIPRSRIGAICRDEAAAQPAPAEAPPPARRRGRRPGP